MPNTEKAELIKLLDENRAQTLAVFEEVDGATVIYPDGNWTLKDVIVHLTVWEEEGVNALLGIAEEKPYPPPVTSQEELEAFNNRQVQQRRHLSLEQAYSDFQSTRNRLKALLNDLSAEDFSQSFAFPWYGEGTVSDMLHGLVQHEQRHVRHVQQPEKRRKR